MPDLPATYYLIGLLLAVFIFIAGIDKFHQKGVYSHPRFLAIIIIGLSAVPVFIDFNNVWEDVPNRGRVILVLIVFATVLIYALKRELTSRRYTIYNIEEASALELVEQILIDLDVPFKREVDNFNNDVYNINDCKAKITVKNQALSDADKDVIITHTYDFPEIEHFTDALILNVLERYPDHKYKGVWEMAIGVGLFILVAAFYFNTF
ncbi:hypothetical protein [Desulfuribacillus alkaliarsenatis]|uniref:Uncharacterized protein n=1 Tax=Desulfuribacillus alkaliarsenatis TaxID=766136 RepID=A0A1E5G427_9FIRM|nr:hypothetical protein [Desulfuribacillus alkaliarsenatis]OEF97419.1 hypothetical protein BHF68_04210 [Desulfuribacillus alkaliarsenatis]